MFSVVHDNARLGMQYGILNSVGPSTTHYGGKDYTGIFG
jgi:hypothetical protein